MADSRIEELRRRIERDPESRLFAQLAEQLRKEGELEEAIGVARAGLQRHPDYPSARLTLGRALLDSGDPAAARTELDAAVKGAPDNILASRLLGEALETLGDLGGAVLQYRKTLEMAPSDRHVEARIQAIQERLGAPAKGGEGADDARASEGRSADLTKPMKAVRRQDAPPPPPAGAGAEEPGLPPTIRIRMPGDPGGGVRAPMPPPTERALASRETAPPAEGGRAPAGEPSKEESTLPARTRGAEEGLPGTLPGRGGAGEAKPPPDSDLAPTLPSSRAAEYAAIDESLPPTVPPGSVTTPAGLEAEGGAAVTGAREEAGVDGEGPAAPEPPPSASPEPPAATPEPPPPTPEAAPPLADSPPPAVELPAPEAAPREPPEAEPSLLATERPSVVEPPAEGTPPAPVPATASLEPADKTGKPLSSGTLAELYFQQGLLDRAIAVYREVIAGEPGNEAARARLAEIQAEAEASVSGGPTRPPAEVDGRASRRRVLERTIARLEALLAIVQGR
ncbi:MAG: tetratricopeptide repeat protein [Acidobacteria bacterium]|nr:tetratricopeptide repeat protein [Acidobacteriota bacterium]